MDHILVFRQMLVQVHEQLQQPDEQDHIAVLTRTDTASATCPPGRTEPV